MRTLSLRCLSFGLFLFGAVSAVQAGTILGPSAYLQASDSPFSALSFNQYFYLENFESGALTTPGAALSGACCVLSPGALTDSVNGDSGPVDGNGNSGHSLYVNTNTLRVVFNPLLLGGIFPTHVGIVWTDVGFTSSGPNGVGPVKFEAFDASNVSLGSVTSILGDGLFGGQTAEDRFFGAISTTGIAAFEISMNNSTDWEVDHLQYGADTNPVPEPGSLVLIASGLVLVALPRLRRLRRT